MRAEIMMTAESEPPNEIARSKIKNVKTAAAKEVIAVIKKNVTALNLTKPIA